MEKEPCICSVISLLQGENAQDTAVFLTRYLWEHGEKRRVLYIPAGMQFEQFGTVSLTELYFSYRKQKLQTLPFEQRKPLFVKPFHCFLEGGEIENMKFYGFLRTMAELADCTVFSLDGISPERLPWFLENSSMVAVLTMCTSKELSPQFTGFLRNLRLLWGEELGEQLKRFLFILPGGGLDEKEMIQRQLRAEGIFLTGEEAHMVFVTEQEITGRKMSFWKRGRENGRNPI